MTDPTDPEPGPSDSGASDPGSGSGSDSGKNASAHWTRPFIYICIGVIVFAVGIYVGSSSDTPEATPVSTEHAHDSDAGADDAETIWTCAMHPQIRLHEPGQCPICGMDLIPDEAGHGGDGTAGRVFLSPRAKQLAKVSTAPVEYRGTSVDLRLLGRLEMDESQHRMITPWTGGRIDRLYVNNTGARIKKGQVVALLYSPEIYSAHQDLIAARRQVERLKAASPIAKNSAQRALEAARERLRLLGIPNADLREMEKAKQPWRQVKVRSSYSGTVTELPVAEGAYVEAGTPLYHTADLGNIWVQLDAYESDLPRVRVGRKVELEVESFPGETFRGKVAFVDPVVDPSHRTTRVRVEVPNPERKLRPGMFARAVLHAPDKKREEGTLVIPATAALFTGKRSVVYVEVPESKGGGYEPREVELGVRSGDVYPVISGLNEGERVVSRGVFAVDSDLQIRGGHSMMAHEDDLQREARQGVDVSVEVSPEFRDGLRPILDGYVAIQERLAADDLPGAKRAFDQLGSKTRAFKPREHQALWKEFSSQITELTATGARSNDLKAARATFDTLSQVVIRMLGRLGNPLAGPLEIAFCPMANDGDGAQWLQRSGDIVNPYMGQAMLACGEIQSTLGPGGHPPRAAAPAPAASPPASEGHKH